MTPLMQGFIVGLLTCAPLGPIGVIATRRALTGGRLAGVCSGSGADTVPTLLLVVGVFLGSAAWSPLLASGLSRLDLQKDLRRMRALNRVCGGLIGVIGLTLGVLAWVN